MKLKIAVLFSLILFVAGQSQAATITQLTGFGQFQGVIWASNDFEATINVPGVTFDASAQRFTSAQASGGVTSSGVWGLGEFIANEPLRASLGADAHEVGLFFGNDDFNLIFNAELRVYDAANNLLGGVTVLSNGNDWVDQFIGLRSDTAFRFVDISYQRPPAQGLAVFIDDFKVARAVPEPSSLLLMGAGLVALRLVKKSRNSQ